MRRREISPKHKLNKSLVWWWKVPPKKQSWIEPSTEIHKIITTKVYKEIIISQRDVCFARPTWNLRWFDALNANKEETPMPTILFGLNTKILLRKTNSKFPILAYFFHLAFDMYDWCLTVSCVLSNRINLFSISIKIYLFFGHIHLSVKSHVIYVVGGALHRCILNVFASHACTYSVHTQIARQNHRQTNTKNWCINPTICENLFRSTQFSPKIIYILRATQIQPVSQRGSQRLRGYRKSKLLNSSASKCVPQ